MAATRAELAAIIRRRGDGLARNERDEDAVPTPALTALLAIDLTSPPGAIRAEVRRVLAEHYPGRTFVGPHVYRLGLALEAGRARGPG